MQTTGGLNNIYEDIFTTPIFMVFECHEWMAVLQRVRMAAHTLGEEIPLGPVCCASRWMSPTYEHWLFQLVFPTASPKAWFIPCSSQWQDPSQAHWELDLALKLWLQQQHHEIRGCSKVILHREVPLCLWIVKSKPHFKCQKWVGEQEGERLFYEKSLDMFELFTSFFFLVWDGPSSAGDTLRSFYTFIFTYFLNHSRKT